MGRGFGKGGIGSKDEMTSSVKVKSNILLFYINVRYFVIANTENITKNQPNGRKAMRRKKKATHI